MQLKIKVINVVNFQSFPSSGAFQPEHVQPHLGGVRGSDGARQTTLSQGHEQHSSQQQKWEQGWVQSSSGLSKRAGADCPHHEWWPIARVQFHCGIRRWPTLSRKNPQTCENVFYEGQKQHVIRGTKYLLYLFIAVSSFPNPIIM